MTHSIFTKIWLDLMLLKNSIELSVLTMIMKAEKALGSAEKKTCASESESAKSKDTAVTFEGIAGNDAAKQILEEIVSGMKDRRSDKPTEDNMPSAVLLYGPHGTGKSMLLDAAANAANVPFFVLDGSTFLSQYGDLGGGVVKFVLKQAKETKDSCIIFIDDIDAIAGRSTDRGTYNALRENLNEIRENPNVLVIAAASSLSELAQEVCDCFDVKLPLNA